MPDVETPAVRPVADLVGADGAVRRLTEWLSLALDEPELLDALLGLAEKGVRELLDAQQAALSA